MPISLNHTSRSFLDEKPLIGMRERRGKAAHSLIDLRKDIDRAFGRVEAELDLGYALSQNPTGFPNTTDSSISFSASSPDRTFTIQPTVDSFAYYIQGVEHEVNSALTAQIADTEGLHWIYFDNGLLTHTATFIPDIILSGAFVAGVYWDATNAKFRLYEERHGVSMSPATHLHLHRGLGSLWYSGLGLTEIISDGDGSSNTHAQVGVGSGSFADEDILHTFITQAAPAPMCVMYKSGANGDWRWDADSNYPIKTAGTGRAAWNEWTGATWQVSEVANNRFCLSHIFATNDVNACYYAILGESTHLSLNAARDTAETELRTIILNGLPSAEFVALGTLIWQTSDSYSNAVKSRIRTNTDGADYLDWRGAIMTPSNGYGIGGNNVVDAVVSVADASGGATATALTVDIKTTTSLVVNKTCVFLLWASDSQYGGSRDPNANITLDTVSKGSILANDAAAGWWLLKTDVSGQFACNANNSIDEQVWFTATSAEGADAVENGILIRGCVADDATWSA